MDLDPLGAAWERFRSSRELEPAGSEQPVDLAAIAVELRALLGRWFPPEAVARFELPAAAQRWFAGAGRTSWGDANDWVSLASADLLPVITEDRWLVLGEELPARSELWIVIGGWSDKHDYMLCCDRDSPRFGNVADWNDTHPWSDPTAQPDSLWPDLVAFFARPEHDADEDRADD